MSELKRYTFSVACEVTVFAPGIEDAELAVEEALLASDSGAEVVIDSKDLIFSEDGDA